HRVYLHDEIRSIQPGREITEKELGLAIADVSAAITHPSPRLARNDVGPAQVAQDIDRDRRTRLLNDGGHMRDAHSWLATYRWRGDRPHRTRTVTSRGRKCIPLRLGAHGYRRHRLVLHLHHRRVGKELGAPIRKLESGIRAPYRYGSGN